jgi:hypothetical protein
LIVAIDIIQLHWQLLGGISSVYRILTIVAPEIRRYPNLIRRVIKDNEKEPLQKQFDKIFNDDISDRLFRPIFAKKFSKNLPKLVS